MRNVIVSKRVTKAFTTVNLVYLHYNVIRHVHGLDATSRKTTKLLVIGHV